MTTHAINRHVFLGAVIAATLAAAVPGAALAQSAAKAAKPAVAATQGSPSQLVFVNTKRVLSTLESRRAEFNKNRAALQQFIYAEFNTGFDRDYAARQVLGGRG